MKSSWLILEENTSERPRVAPITSDSLSATYLPLPRNASKKINYYQNKKFPFRAFFSKKKEPPKNKNKSIWQPWEGCCFLKKWVIVRLETGWGWFSVFIFARSGPESPPRTFDFLQRWSESLFACLGNNVSPQAVVCLAGYRPRYSHFFSEWADNE